MSPSLRKSVTDLTRRRARTLFSVTTLALAVASVSFFAVPTLIDRAMQAEVRETRLADLTVTMRPLPLTDTQLRELAALANVAAVEPRSSVDVRVLVGKRRVAARVVGVRNFGRQEVDVVRVDSGRLPRSDEALSDVQNANVGIYGGRAGDLLRTVAAGEAASAELRLSGRGRNIVGGEVVQDDGTIVLYATAETVAGLSGERGYNRLAFRLGDTRPEAAAATVRAVRGYLSTVTGFAGFANLPEFRATGDWPGKGETEQFASLLGVITVLALLSALVLVSNTMTTLVAEQTDEIGIMRAVGARRRQVIAVYLRTALLLGALGALVGTILGIELAYLLARYFGQVFWAVDVGLGVDLTVVLAGIVLGLVGPPLAALPSVRRAVRTDLRDALGGAGSPVATSSAAEHALRHTTFLPRTAQIGLRTAAARMRRSVATVVIIALAVGNLLATLGLAAGVDELTRAEWGDHLEDVRVWTAGREPFDARAESVILSTPGVAEAQPALVNDVELAGAAAFVWAVPREPFFRYRISEGRWFSADEERGREPVAVIERNLARATGVATGERVTLDTAAGPTRFRIVGVADNQQENGTVLFVPLTTARALLGRPTGATTYWVRTTSPDHALVDRTTALLEDRLAALGYETGTEITYVAADENVAANRTITTSIGVLGFLVVAISMVGLANALTTSVLERTREIGILRCIGARARDVRRIFTTEGVALALLGWLIGIPLGFVLDRLLVWFVGRVVDVEIPAAFPPWNVLVALVGTLVIALLVTLLPVRRAVRFRPGDALRHA